MLVPDSKKEVPITDLGRFNNDAFDRGRSKLTEIIWTLFSALIVQSRLPGSGLRIMILKAFGARIGRAVVIKERVKIKFPWKLTVKDNAWIGEAAWIDNLADVKIGANACISQGAYLCTGSHNFKKPTFDLMVAPINIGESAWVCAQARVGPGITIEAGAIVSFGAIVTMDLPQMTILKTDGSIKERKMDTSG